MPLFKCLTKHTVKCFSSCGSLRGNVKRYGLQQICFNLKRHCKSFSTKSNIIVNNHTNCNTLSTRNFSSTTPSTGQDTSLHLLPYKNKPFDSIEINVTEDLCEDSSEFASKLYDTIRHARNEGKSSIWINFPMLYSHYIPIAGMYDFKFHHAEGDSSSMLLWLPRDSPNRVPPFATHHCGVAGVVTHGNKLLVVKEKTKLAGWKLPGGYANLGEDLDLASVREVSEETGISTKYINTIAFRHSHNIQFGRSDLYFICRLQVLNDNYDIKECEHEIEQAMWMDISQCEAQNIVPMMDSILSLISDGAGNILPATSDTHATGLDETVLTSTVKGRKPFKFYTIPTSSQ